MYPGLNKSLVQFALLLISLACVFIIILGIQSSAYIINSILLAAMITLAVLPLPRKLVQRGLQDHFTRDFRRAATAGRGAVSRYGRCRRRRSRRGRWYRSPLSRVTH